MIDFKREDLIKRALINALELEKYKKITMKLNEVNVSSDEDYQKTFNSFYKVRRDKKWREHYYSLLEKYKKRKDIDFKEILQAIYKETNRIEASFASKLLAAINTDKPIWDAHVLICLDIKVKGEGDKEARLKKAVETYAQIEKCYKEMLKSKEIVKLLKEFDDIVPEYQISDTKKLDYILWAVKDTLKFEQ